MGAIRKFTTRNFLILVILSALAMSIVLTGGYFFSNSLFEAKTLQINSSATANVKVIENLAASMEQKSTELALFGSSLHSMREKLSPSEIDRILETYLKHTFGTFEQALGGGIWYEPGVLIKDRRFYGPYVFWENNSVKFTWDLSNEKYDYHAWDWYTMALPAGWDRNKARPEKYYWSAPYKDGAGTSALMITVDAFMHDEAGKLIGVSTVDWSLDAILNALEKAKPTPRSQSFLVDKKSGMILLHTLNPASRSASVTTEPELLAILTGPTIQNQKIKGVAYRIQIVPSANGMTYGVFTPLSDINSNRDLIILLEILAAIALTTIFYGLYINVTTRLQEIVKERTDELAVSLQASRNQQEKISLLLDNAEQGFLSFDSDMLIDSEFSRQCKRFFSSKIAGERLDDLLFVADKDKKTFFSSTIKSLGTETNENATETILSLLKNEFVLNRRNVAAKYKKISENRFMLMLTDVTINKSLQRTVEKEQKTLKMVAAAVSNTDEFFEILHDYEQFASQAKESIDKSKTDLYNFSNIYRIIHTFKGLFAQKEMLNTVAGLHGVESAISALIGQQKIAMEALKSLLAGENLAAGYKKDMDLLKAAIGSEFFSQQGRIAVEKQSLEELEQRVAEFALEEADREKCLYVLGQIDRMKSKPLVKYLESYTKLVDVLGTRLHKAIYPLGIVGDANIIVGDKFAPFARSLVHVFRNVVDHGIETMETRLENNKDEFGTVACSVREDAEGIHVVIADDGAGLDLAKIRKKAVDIGLYTSETIDQVDDQTLQYLVFNDNFSTKVAATEISGRGVGLSAVKAALDALGGRVIVSSETDKGTTFHFIMPNSTVPVINYG